VKMMQNDIKIIPLVTTTDSRFVVFSELCPKRWNGSSGYGRSAISLRS